MVKLISTKVFILIASFILCSPVALAIGVYKWVDNHGQTHFSDVPPPPKTSAKVEEVNIKSGKKTATTDNNQYLLKNLNNDKTESDIKSRTDEYKKVKEHHSQEAVVIVRPEHNQTEDQPDSTPVNDGSNDKENKPNIEPTINSDQSKDNNNTDNNLENKDNNSGTDQNNPKENPKDKISIKSQKITERNLKNCEVAKENLNKLINHNIILDKNNKLKKLTEFRLARKKMETKKQIEFFC